MFDSCVAVAMMRNSVSGFCLLNAEMAYPSASTRAPLRHRGPFELADDARLLGVVDRAGACRPLHPHGGRVLLERDRALIVGGRRKASLRGLRHFLQRFDRTHPALESTVAAYSAQRISVAPQGASSVPPVSEPRRVFVASK